MMTMMGNSSSATALIYTPNSLLESVHPRPSPDDLVAVNSASALRLVTTVAE